MRVGWDELRRALGTRAPARVAEQVSRRAAVALILREHGVDLELLFIRRAEDPRDPWSGQMAFPGGRSEPGDGELCVTAMRETAEEVGIDLARGAELLGALDEVRAMARLRPLDLAITPFVFRLDAAAEARLGEEVRSIHWLPLADLLDEGRQSTFDYEHESGTLRFPCLRLGPLVIWGLTYRMFASLAERLRPGRGSDEASAC